MVVKRLNQANGLFTDSVQAIGTELLVAYLDFRGKSTKFQKNSLTKNHKTYR